jgi:hypothetical protein
MFMSEPGGALTGRVQHWRDKGTLLLREYAKFSFTYLQLIACKEEVSIIKTQCRMILYLRDLYGGSDKSWQNSRPAQLFISLFGQLPWKFLRDWKGRNYTWVKSSINISESRRSDWRSVFIHSLNSVLRGKTSFIRNNSTREGKK